MRLTRGKSYLFAWLFFSACLTLVVLFDHLTIIQPELDLSINNSFNNNDNYNSNDNSNTIINKPHKNVEPLKNDKTNKKYNNNNNNNNNNSSNNNSNHLNNLSNENRPQQESQTKVKKPIDFSFNAVKPLSYKGPSIFDVRSLTGPVFTGSGGKPECGVVSRFLMKTFLSGRKILTDGEGSVIAMSLVSYLYSGPIQDLVDNNKNNSNKNNNGMKAKEEAGRFEIWQAPVFRYVGGNVFELTVVARVPGKHILVVSYPTDKVAKVHFRQWFISFARNKTPKGETIELVETAGSPDELASASKSLSQKRYKNMQSNLNNSGGNNNNTPLTPLTRKRCVGWEDTLGALQSEHGAWIIDSNHRMLVAKGFSLKSPINPLDASRSSKDMRVNTSPGGVLFLPHAWYLTGIVNYGSMNNGSAAGKYGTSKGEGRNAARPACSIDFLTNIDAVRCLSDSNVCFNLVGDSYTRGIARAFMRLFLGEEGFMKWALKSPWKQKSMIHHFGDRKSEGPHMEFLNAEHTIPNAYKNILKKSLASKHCKKIISLGNVYIHGSSSADYASESSARMSSKRLAQRCTSQSRKFLGVDGSSDRRVFPIWTSTNFQNTAFKPQKYRRQAGFGAIDAHVQCGKELDYLWEKSKSKSNRNGMRYLSKMASMKSLPPITNIDGGHYNIVEAYLFMLSIVHSLDCAIGSDVW